MLYYLAGQRQLYLTGPPALKFKQGSDRRIAINPLDRFAQQSRDGQGGYFQPVNRRA
jgi:hypothetical protein